MKESIKEDKILYKSPRRLANSTLSFIFFGLLLFPVFILPLYEICINQKYKAIILTFALLPVFIFTCFSLLNDLSTFIILENGISKPILPFSRKIEIIPYEEILEFTYTEGFISPIILRVEIHTKDGRQLSYIQRGDKNHNTLAYLKNALIQNNVKKVDYLKWECWSRRGKVKINYLPLYQQFPNERLSK